jgi:hypothetical protein
MLDDPERWRTAVHEAGHVIAAALKNVPVHLVTIVPNDETWGRMEYETAGLPWGCLAGPAAELAVLGDTLGHGSDLARARARLGPLIRPVWRAVYREMRLHRRKVRAVASALLHRQTLGVQELYDNVLPPLIPTATHPDLHRYEESLSEWAARVGADHWEPEDDGCQDAEDPLRLPQSTGQEEPTCWPY